VADPAVVATKLQQIEQHYGELREKQAVSRERFLADVTERRAVERMFENAIQACIDLAKHVATTALGYEGDSSKESMEVLWEHNVISDETATTMTTAVGFRNVLAHEYGTVDPERVYTYLPDGISDQSPESGWPPSVERVRRSQKTRLSRLVRSTTSSSGFSGRKTLFSPIRSAMRERTTAVTRVQ
jgi:uncharacterized protein YutE (UPF0331/DUF86 family)